MNVLEKAKILSNSGQYDSCGPKSCEVKVKSGLGGIYYAKAEHKTCRIFKTLMNNSCKFDCKYCANPCAKKKAGYEPKELATLFDYLQKSLAVDGLFLSSGVSGNPDKVTEKMLEAVKILRFNYKFKGYIHFKILPGTSYELIKQASELSTRMSINIEAPNKSALSELSSCKDYKIDILRRQAWISKMKISQTTQVIVNRLSTDFEVLKMANWEYDALELKRIYYSAFRPVKDTPLENEKPESKLREHRLYNVDFLLRRYNYRLKEFKEIMDDGMLPREDPKLALAKMNLEPVDINECSYGELLRVPGIGPKSAKNITLFKSKIKKYEQLKDMGVVLNRAKPFIRMNGLVQSRITEF
jgi:predicted DNA-binding helix-hairpin-helix protein